MNVFDLRERLIDDYGSFLKSFICIRDARIRRVVEEELEEGRLWPSPLTQLNPAFQPGTWVDELVNERILHARCANVFRREKSESDQAAPTP